MFRKIKLLYDAYKIKTFIKRYSKFYIPLIQKYNDPYLIDSFCLFDYRNIFFFKKEELIELLISCDDDAVRENIKNIAEKVNYFELVDYVHKA